MTMIANGWKTCCPVPSPMAEGSRPAIVVRLVARIGRKRMLDLRERAERVLGPDFDFVEFHDTVLTGGPRPLSILEEDIERWYTAKIRR